MPPAMPPAVRTARRLKARQWIGLAIEVAGAIVLAQMALDLLG